VKVVRLVCRLHGHRVRNQILVLIHGGIILRIDSGVAVVEKNNKNRNLVRITNQYRDWIIIIHSRLLGRILRRIIMKLLRVVKRDCNSNRNSLLYLLLVFLEFLGMLLLRRIWICWYLEMNKVYIFNHIMIWYLDRRIKNIISLP